MSVTHTLSCGHSYVSYDNLIDLPRYSTDHDVSSSFVLYLHMPGTLNITPSISGVEKQLLYVRDNFWDTSPDPLSPENCSINIHVCISEAASRRVLVVLDLPVV